MEKYVLRSDQAPGANPADHASSDSSESLVGDTGSAHSDVGSPPPPYRVVQLGVLGTYVSDNMAGMAAASQAAAITDPAERESRRRAQLDYPRPMFKKPFAPFCEDYSPRNRPQVGVIKTLRGITLTATYKSEFLEMATKQDHKAREESIVNTMAHRNRCESKAKLYGPMILERCLLSHWLVQHSVYILDEIENLTCKTNAVQSFPDDVAGNWQYPHGDVLVIPRKNTTTPYHYLEALKDIEEGLLLIHSLPESYKISLEPLTKDEIDFENAKIQNDTAPRTKLIIYKLFKPIFSKIYFKYVDPNVTSYGVMLALQMLQKACLVLIPLCDFAIQCKNHGGALFLAQTLYSCTRYMDVLLQSDKLELDNVYTHTMASWYLGRCFYTLWRQDKEIPSTLYVEYNKMKSELESFSLSLDGFTKDFAEEIENIRSLNKLKCPTTPKFCSHWAFEDYLPLLFPPTWKRSPFQQFHLSLADQWYRIENCIRNIAKKRSPENTLKTHYEELLASVAGTTRRYDVHCFSAPIVVIFQLAAICCRYRAILFGAMRGYSAKKVEESTRDLYREMGDCQLRAFDLFQRSIIRGVQSRALYTDIQLSFLCYQFYYQVEMEERQSCWPFSLAILMRALVFSLSMWENGELISGVKKDTNKEWRMHALDEQMAVFCAGVSLINSIKYQRKSDLDERIICERNARYYHVLMTLYIRRRPKVIPALLRFFYDLAEPFITVALACNDKKKFKRELILHRYKEMFQRLVYALPLLWELDVTDSSQQHIMNYYPIKIRKAALPFSQEEVKPDISKRDLMIHKHILKHMQNLIDKRQSPSQGEIDLTEFQRSKDNIVESLLEISRVDLSEEISIEVATTRIRQAITKIINSIFLILKIRRGAWESDVNWKEFCSSFSAGTMEGMIKNIYTGDEVLPAFGFVATALSVICIIVTIVLTRDKIGSKDGNVETYVTTLLKIMRASLKTIPGDERRQRGDGSSYLNVKCFLSGLLEEGSIQDADGLEVIRSVFDKVSEVFQTTLDYENLDRNCLKMIGSAFMKIMKSMMLNKQNEDYVGATLEPIALIIVERVVNGSLPEMSYNHDANDRQIKFYMSKKEMFYSLGILYKDKLLSMDTSDQSLVYVPPENVTAAETEETVGEFELGPFSCLEQYHLEEERQWNFHGTAEIQQTTSEVFRYCDTASDAIRIFHSLFEKTLTSFALYLKKADDTSIRTQRRIPSVLPPNLYENVKFVQEILSTKQASRSVGLATALHAVEELLLPWNNLRLWRGVLRT